MNLCHRMDGGDGQTSWTFRSGLGKIRRACVRTYRILVGGGSICQICMWHNYNCKVAEKRRLHTISAKLPNVLTFDSRASILVSSLLHSAKSSWSKFYALLPELFSAAKSTNCILRWSRASRECVCVILRENLLPDSHLAFIHRK